MGDAFCYGDIDGLLHHINMKYCKTARAWLKNSGTPEDGEIYDRYRTKEIVTNYEYIMACELRPRIELEPRPLDEYPPIIRPSTKTLEELQKLAKEEYKNARNREGKERNHQTLIAAIDVLETAKKIEFNINVIKDFESQESLWRKKGQDERIELIKNLKQNFSDTDPTLLCVMTFMTAANLSMVAVRIAELMERMSYSYHMMALNDIHANASVDTGSEKKGKGTKEKAIKIAAINLVNGDRRVRFIDDNGGLDEVNLKSAVLAMKVANKPVCSKNTYDKYMTGDLLKEVKKALLT